MMNNNESPTLGTSRHHEDADELMQELQQLWDQRDAQLTSAMDQLPPVVATARPSRWWRYAAAAAVVLLLGGGLVWMYSGTTKPEPLLAVAHTPQLHPNTEMPHTEATEEPSLATAPNEISSQKKAKANTANTIPPTATLEQAVVAQESEIVLMGIPADESFAAATIEGGEQQAYVRCNNLCDARDIINQAKEVL